MHKIVETETWLHSVGFTNQNLLKQYKTYEQDIGKGNAFLNHEILVFELTKNNNFKLVGVAN